MRHGQRVAGARRGRIAAAIVRRRMLELRRLRRESPGGEARAMPREAPPAAAQRRNRGAGQRRSPSRGDISAFDIAMVERALRLARRAAAEGEVPVAAVVYRDGVMLGEAYNRREGVPDPLGHAELLALRAAGERLGHWRLAGCSIAVTLEPCTMCAGALVNARVARLIYGAADIKSGACESLYAIPEDHRLNHRLTVVRGVFARESAALLGRFFAARRAAAAKRGRPAEPGGDRGPIAEA
ncbi:MAG TPA: nucleoside deaminase [Phycisphaerales bacterium]|nr:nucleoside deaminase [Phycisphaerales bacterium]HMP38171.1 nucleoside deaminase [Phycisphaerales bacterium]